MSVPQPPLGLSGGSSRRFVGAASLAAALVAAACLSPDRDRLTAADPPTTTGGTPKETLFGGRPLFAGWPKGQTPDAVIVFTGQTWGYLQPCGCSRPQTGGLERRAVFIKQLKDKGWPVAGVDLATYPENRLADQETQVRPTLKASARWALRRGIGKTESGRPDMHGPYAGRGAAPVQLAATWGVVPGNQHASGCSRPAGAAQRGGANRGRESRRCPSVSQAGRQGLRMRT